tara:strand:+ start:37221 stop:38354 length:1134 start_codon:yes stop_codon:yes gene_type:complete
VKRLLFIVNVDWFFISHRLPIATKAINKGYEVHIATKVTDKLDTLKSHGLIVHPLNLHRSKLSLLSFIKEFWNIYSIIKLIKPSILHLVTIKPVLFGGIASRLLNTPSVVSAISGLGHVFSKKGIIGFFQRKVASFLYFFALSHKNQLIIFQNKDDRAKLLKNTKLHSQKTVIIHGSGIDLTFYKVKPMPAEKPVVLFASRLIAEKGIREFVKAARIINRDNIVARFIVAGSPDFLNPSSITQSELDEWKEKKYVEILGHHTDMVSIISSSNLVVFPSYYGEGLPKILIEAAACGRPVITTDHPGCRDAIKNNLTGLLVPVKNTKNLVDSINYMLCNPTLRAKMGKEGRKWAEEMFDINKVVAMHLTLYSELNEKVW